MGFRGAAHGPDGRAVLPPHVFDTPVYASSALGMRCLMRDEDGTFRAAEGRIAERRVEPWAWVSCLTTLRGRHRWLRRLDAMGLEQLLRAGGGRAHAAAEAAGDLRTVCVQREQGWESGVTGCQGLQWTMALDIDRRLFLVQTARPNPPAGPMRLVLAAAACEHGRNH
jgi:hypothetical protein